MIIQEIQHLISEVTDIEAEIKLGSLESKFPGQSKLTQDLNTALASKGIGDKFDSFLSDVKTSAEDFSSEIFTFFGKVKNGIGTVIDNVKAEAERTPGNIKQS